jgi:hypothetical protein
VRWEVHGQISNNTNKVLSTNAYYAYACDITLAGAGSINSCVRAGYPLGAIFARRITGYADRNGDGFIETNEIQLSDSAAYLGVGTPHYTSSFGTTVSFLNGRLSLATQGDYQNGTTIRNFKMRQLLSSAANLPAADQATQALATITNVNNLISTGVQTVSVLRWDDLSLTYTLPDAIAQFFHGTQANISLQGSNLALVTNYRGKDPAVTYITDGLGVWDNGSSLPQPRTWRLAVRVTQ